MEDDVYRASSQYRYWSYTKESLARIRQNTNDLASERVKAAFQRAYNTKPAQNGATDDSRNNGTHDGAANPDVQTLTVEEELKVVEWGCSKITDMGEAMNPRIPSHIMVRGLLCARQRTLGVMIFRLVRLFGSLADCGCRLQLSSIYDDFISPTQS